VRTWVAYLRDTVQDGQVWIATHSLEAVEVAGHDATFVLEREGDTRVVARADPLSERPVISVLSSTLGSPAFSISRLRFIYMEGERQTRERERFHIIVGDASTNRFMEAGNGREVLRKVEVLRELAAETGEPLRIGGVLDRDFRTDDEVASLEADRGVHVLGVHEVENLLLQPEALRVLVQRSGGDPESVLELIRRASDRFAGLWILQRGAHIAEIRDLQSAIRQAAGNMDWDTFEPDPDGAVQRLADSHDFAGEDEAPFRDALRGAATEYSKSRESPDLWKSCLGKQVLAVIPGSVGLTNQVTLERTVTQLWVTGEIAPSNEADALSQYVAAL